MEYEGEQAARVVGSSLNSSRKHTGSGLPPEEGHKNLPTRNKGPVAPLRSLYSFYQPPWVLLLTAHNCSPLQRIVLGQLGLPSPEVSGVYALTPSVITQDIPEPMTDRGKSQKTHSLISRIGLTLVYSSSSGAPCEMRMRLNITRNDFFA